MWINAAVSLLQNPTTGDVEAVSYAKDITRQKKDEEIISRFSSEGCDFLGIIEPASETFELHDGGWESGIEQGKKTGYRLCGTDSCRATYRRGSSPASPSSPRYPRCAGRWSKTQDTC
jgi:hypothetical protein